MAENCIVPQHTEPHQVPWDPRDTTVQYTTLHYTALHFTSHHVMPHHATPCHAMPHHARPRQARPGHASPRHATPHHATPRHATPRHAMPRHTSPHLTTLDYTSFMSKVSVSWNQDLKAGLYTSIHVVVYCWHSNTLSELCYHSIGEIQMSAEGLFTFCLSVMSGPDSSCPLC